MPIESSSSKMGALKSKYGLARAYMNRSLTHLKVNTLLMNTWSMWTKRKNYKRFHHNSLLLYSVVLFSHYACFKHWKSFKFVTIFKWSIVCHAKGSKIILSYIQLLSSLYIGPTVPQPHRLSHKQVFGNYQWKQKITSFLYYYWLIFIILSFLDISQSTSTSSL